jgi:hypothetical protein
MGDKRAELERVLVRLWEALDGTRQIITGYGEAGEPYTATEHAAPVAAAIVKVLNELAALPVESGAVAPGVMTIDDAKRRRSDRQAAAQAQSVAGEGGRKRR